MITIGMRHDRAGPSVRPARAGMARQALLACGILSSLLYVATDLIGGMRYEAYSFTAQAISELGAIGAPSKPVIDPLFFTYNVIVLAFGVAVFREAAGRNRPLRITGAMLFCYGAIGFAVFAFAGPTYFAMQQRGAGSLATDAPHLILTGVLVLLLLLAMGFGAFALGTRFRVYSFATLLIVILFGVLASRLAPQVAAGRPTPGLGILERINVYAALLWVAVLGVALLRRPRSEAR